jgi:LPS-assembly lipoprotein
MSSSNYAIGRVVLLALSLSLSGCFQPLYHTSASGLDMRDELASISVEPLPDRMGHYLANELSFRFHGGGDAPSPRYRLKISLHERIQTPLVDTVSGRASAATVMVDADYKLVDSDSAQTIAQGTAFTAASYDRSSQRFANIRAARDAEIRDAKTLADQIHTRIAAALSAGR